MKQKILSFIYNKKIDKFLLLNMTPHIDHAPKGGWFTVTGKIENDENPKKAVKREIKEETSLDAKNIFNLNFGSIYNWKGELCKELNYLSFVDNIEVSLNEEHIGHEWLSINNYIKKIDWDDDKDILKKVLKKGINEKLYFKKLKFIDYRKIKDTVNWSGQIYEMEWLDKFPDKIFNNLQQVYGFLFNNEGKICIVKPTEKRGWRLPGGGLEPEDKNWKDTIIREANEEADIKLDKNSLKIIGAIKISPKSDNCERKTGYALRVVGKIVSINKQTEDVSDGLINERKFIEPKEFLNYCSWGDFGKHQLNKALDIWKNGS